jgi:zinc ribbon protein
MHCPNCGTKASANQKFCRSCGFGLERVEELIAEQKTSITDQTAEATGRLSNKLLRKLKKWAGVALFAMGGIFVSMLLWKIIFKVMIEEGKIWEGSVVLMIIGSAVLALLLAYLNSEHIKKSTATRSNQPKHPPQSVETAKMLPEPNTEMAASVTEQTTSKLEETIIRRPSAN